MSPITKRALALVLGLAACGGAEPALAAPCPPGPPQYDVYLKDRSVLSSEATPLENVKGPLPLLHSFEVSLVGGIENVNLQPPAGVPFRRDGTRTVIVAPKTAGPLAIAATWTQQEGNSTCEGATTITLQIAPLTQRPRVRFTRFNAIDRPLVEFTVRVDRGQLADAAPLTVRARVGTGAAAPGGRPRALFTLRLAPPDLGTRPPPSGYLSRRSARVRGFVVRGLSAFDENNAEQIDVPPGGTGVEITFGLNGARIARRGLVVEIVQRGRVLGRLATGILCGSRRCRLPGYRTR